MSYVQLDDAFASHPKIALLSDRAFRVHLRALCYCAHHRTSGQLPPPSEIPKMSVTTTSELLEAGVWEDRNGEGIWIHDYADYNGTKVQREQARDRKRRQRERDKSVTKS